MDETDDNGDPFFVLSEMEAIAQRKKNPKDWEAFERARRHYVDREPVEDDDGE